MIPVAFARARDKRLRTEAQNVWVDSQRYDAKFRKERKEAAMPQGCTTVRGEP